MPLPFFTVWQFAAAGAVCALGPVIIHLLNRQRYRTVQWAAMDFLREAIQRNRRILQIRDIILLVLRTAAILLFGLALARPFFSAQTSTFDQRQPLHAILLIDNSLSMGYESLDGDLLSKAKSRAKDFLDQLPVGSKTTVIPICGSIEPVSPDPYDTQEMALEAIDRIAIVDRSAQMQAGINLARQAALSAPNLAKRVVFFGDQQQLNWQDLDGKQFDKEELPVQIVDVSAPDWENSWIADVRVQDDLADIETPTTILVEVAHRGENERRDVPVTLSMGDTVIGEKTVTLEPGPGTRQIEFQYLFNNLTDLPEADRPVYVTLKASLPADHLPGDDERFLAVPVVAALPVVFIDQYGDQEDPAKNKLGETRHLRQLLAPKTDRQDAGKALVQIRHIRLEELSQDILSDARLVVIAGIHDPGSAVPLLREYVRQGGSLVIAAGADFDPAAWNTAAWEDGEGILPLPLVGDMIGEIPEIAGDRLKPFFLSFESLSGQEVFQLPNVSDDDLRDLYAEAFFFKAVDVDQSNTAVTKAQDELRQRLSEELGFLNEAAARGEEYAEKEAKGQLSQADHNQKEADEQRREELRPTWLSWAQSPEKTAAAAAEDRLPADSADRERKLDQLVELQRPHVLARFVDQSGPAFLVEGRIDRGRVLFVATGLQSSWNTLPKTNAMVMFDRLLRGMVVQTLPVRNLDAVERFTLPVPRDDRDLVVSLVRPGKDSAPEALDVGFVGQDRRGVTISHLFRRGVYHVRGMAADEASSNNEETKPLWEVPLVVNGDPAESELDPLSRTRFDELAADTNLRWVETGEEISLAGTALYSQNSWWWLILAVLAFLLIEMGMLAWPVWRDSQVPIATSTTLAGRGAAA